MDILGGFCLSAVDCPIYLYMYGRLLFLSRFRQSDNFYTMGIFGQRVEYRRFRPQIRVNVWRK